MLYIKFRYTDRELFVLDPARLLMALACEFSTRVLLVEGTGGGVPGCRVFLTVKIEISCWFKSLVGMELCGSGPVPDEVATWESARRDSSQVWLWRRKRVTYNLSIFKTNIDFPEKTYWVSRTEEWVVFMERPWISFHSDTKPTLNAHREYEKCCFTPLFVGRKHGEMIIVEYWICI